MSSEDEEGSSEGRLLLAEFRRLQQEARDAIRAARDENTAYLSELRDATAQLASSQTLLSSSSPRQGARSHPRISLDHTRPREPTPFVRRFLAAAAAARRFLGRCREEHLG